MNRKELIEEVSSLPVEERASLVDTLLQSLNRPDSEIDKQWITEAQRRLAEVKSGAVQPVQGQAVFNRIWNKFKV
jgi:putative addiction module component (TIGR02574 family)